MGDQIVQKAVLIAAAEGTRSKFAHTFSDLNHIVRTIPDDWKGRMVRFWVVKPIATTDAATAWVLCGTSASMEVDRTAIESGTPPAWTSNPKIGDPVQANGAPLDVYIEHGFTHFSAEADTAGITISAIVSDLDTVAPSKLHGLR